MTQPLSPPLQQPVQKKSGGKNPWVWGAVLALALGGGTLAGCNNSSDTSAASAPTTVQSTTAQPSAAVQPPAATTPPPAPTSAAVNFAMPSVVGLDLQSAQNLIQTNGVFFSTSHDLRGNRQQVLDSNWIVCTQNIPAGQQVTGDAEGAIDLGVVKREESCP